MEDIIGRLLVLCILLGLEVVAIVVLILSAIYARQLSVVITCGVVAAVVMAVEYCFCFIWAAGGYADGVGGEALPGIVAVVSIVSLGIYFPIALRRCKRRQKIPIVPSP
jgi:hypothetical protein